MQKCPYYVVLYMQSVLIVQCSIYKVSLLCSALNAKCPYYVVLYMAPLFAFVYVRVGLDRMHASDRVHSGAEEGRSGERRAELHVVAQVHLGRRHVN